jgi:predicted enzyme related to lactoylglutathione lyase
MGIFAEQAVNLSPDANAVPQILRARSVLAVQDLERSRRFYVDVMGFSEDAISSPGWSFLTKDAFHLMLGECRDEVPASATGNHSWYMHLLVDDVDAYHRELKSRGAQIENPPTNRAYGLREFILTTPDGHRLVIGQTIVA